MKASLNYFAKNCYGGPQISEDLLNEKSMWEELEKSLISKLKQLEAENIKLKEAKNEKKLNSFNQNEHS